MLGPGDLLFAAALTGGAGGVEIDSVTAEGFTPPASCSPVSGRQIDVSYTASGVTSETVRVERLIDGMFDKTIHTGDLQTAETVTDTLPYKAPGGPSSEGIVLSYRVRAFSDPLTEVASRESATQEFDADTEECTT